LIGLVKYFKKKRSYLKVNAIIKIKELILFFEKLREDGFLDLIEEGRELARKVGIEPVFTIKRVVRRKKQFDEDVGEDVNGS
jgi:hypothetical protein